MILTLNEQEQRLARHIAQLRQDVNRSLNVTNKKAASESDIEIAVIGYGAEIAVAKYFNVYPDFGVKFEHADYDLITSKGIKVDVKCAMKNNVRVYVEGEKTAYNDMFYFFVRNEYPSYYVLGWEWSSVIIKAENYLSENVRRPCYAYPVNKLRKVT